MHQNRAGIALEPYSPLVLVVVWRFHDLVQVVAERNEVDVRTQFMVRCVQSTQNRLDGGPIIVLLVNERLHAHVQITGWRGLVECPQRFACG